MGIDICLIEPGTYPSELHNNRFNEYGELKNAPMEMVSAMIEAFRKMDEVPYSNEIAMKIEELIELTFGNRSVRSVVGSIATDDIRELNK